MNTRYPNIELIVYKVKEQLARDKTFTKLLGQKLGENIKPIDISDTFEVDMFLQKWRLDERTTEYSYTVVVHERMTGVYVVCFNENPTYFVFEPTNEFLFDLQMHQLSRSPEGY